MTKSETSYGHPVLLNIEPINICDHRCMICETGQDILDREPCAMTYDQFKHILDQFDSHLKTIFFYFMGESFLNRDAYRMIRYAADRGLYVSACTNGLRIDPEALVRSGIADIQFQIAGMTPEVHVQYRVDGDLGCVLDNVKKTLQLRQRYAHEVSRPYPMKIGLGFILLKTNEHQIDEFKRLALEIGVDESNIIDPCVRTIDQARTLLPTDRNHWIYDPKAFEGGELRLRASAHGYCEWIYGTMTIMANGAVVPCCRDTKGKKILGNAFHENIYDIWNNSKYRSLRRAVAKRQLSRSLCRLCEGYGMPKTIAYPKTNDL